MRTNIDLNDELMAEAFLYASEIRSKKDLVEAALKEFVANRKRKDLRELKGKITFSDNYN